MTVAPGAPAPDLRLPGEDGDDITLAELIAPGAAVLAFFKTTCPTCRLAFPVYGELHKRYGDALPVVAVSQDPLDRARPWLDDLGFDGPVLDDASGGYAVSAAYELETVPTTVLIGGDGTVRHVVEGWDREGVNELARLLGDDTSRFTAPVSTENDGRPPFKPG